MWPEVIIILPTLWEFFYLIIFCESRKVRGGVHGGGTGGPRGGYGGCTGGGGDAHDVKRGGPPGGVRGVYGG